MYKYDLAVHVLLFVCSCRLFKTKDKHGSMYYMEVAEGNDFARCVILRMLYVASSTTFDLLQAQREVLGGPVFFIVILFVFLVFPPNMYALLCLSYDRR